MTYGHNRIVDALGSPVQQSLTIDPRDYVGMNLSRLMLGVVLEVYPADNVRNRSAYQTADFRGYFHTATVLIVQDGRDTFMPLENVIITPDHISGLDDYCEHLPRGCSSLVTGAALNSQFNHINPYDLDGDWCVVGFLGGSLDQPFIVRWWPHARNHYDPATSGQTNPAATGEGATLVQDGRYFRRINGVEFVVTKQGNLYLSTYRANSTLKFGSDTAPEEGRWPRTLQDDEGGSIKAWLKPSQSFELDFNAQENGMGILDVADAEVPQTNPATNGSASQTEKENTYVLFDKDRIDITVPEEFKLTSRQRILLESEEETTLTVGSDLSVSTDGDTSLDVGGSLTTSVTSNASFSITGNLDLDVTGQTTVTATGPVSIQAQSTFDLTVTGAANLNASGSMNIGASGALGLSGSTLSISAGGASGTPGSIGVTPGGISLGTGALGGAVGGVPLIAALATFASSLATAAAANPALAPVATAAATLLTAVSTTAVSNTTTVG